MVASTEKYPGLMAGSSKATDVKGQFRLGGVFPSEPYLLQLLAVPPNAYVARVYQGERAVQGAMRVLPSNEAGPVRVVLRDDSAQIAGTVSGNGRPAAGAFVVLAPKQREAVHRFQTAAVGKDGSFLFSGVAPGDYELFAFESDEDDAYLDAGFLARFSARAVRVSAAASQANFYNLTLLR